MDKEVIDKLLVGLFPGAGTLGFLAMTLYLIKDAVIANDGFTTISLLLLALCSLAMTVLLGSLTVFIARLD